MRLASTTFIGLTLATLAAGCVQKQSDPSDVRKVLPTVEQVKIKLPQTAGQLAVGDTAEWYRATRGATSLLNGSTAFVLLVVHTIVLFPPTSNDGEKMVWGPHSDALDPAEWKLEVSETLNGSYDWKLLGRNKQAAAGAFEAIISGNADRDAAGFGKGEFTVDFRVAERVNPTENDGSGVFTANYDIGQKSLIIDATDTQVANGQPVEVKSHYEYKEQNDGAGDMLLSWNGDTDDNGSKAEDAVIHSRWLATGAGRADVRVSNGDLQASVTASECWDTAFARTYYADSANWQPSEGQASSCAFATASLPK